MLLPEERKLELHRLAANLVAEEQAAKCRREERLWLPDSPAEQAADYALDHREGR